MRSWPSTTNFISLARCEFCSASRVKSRSSSSSSAIKMVTAFRLPSGIDVYLLGRRRGLAVGTNLNDLFTQVQRQGHGEGRTDPDLTLGDDSPAMALGDFAAQGEPDSRSRVLGTPVQPFEHPEDAQAVLRIEPDAVVAHRQAQLAVAFHRVDRDLGWNAFAVELQAVRDQVLQQLPHLQSIGVD